MRGSLRERDLSMDLYPLTRIASQSDLSPQAGRGLREHYVSIFTYSKSPGLLSMPTFGGEIQGA